MQSNCISITMVYLVCHVYVQYYSNSMGQALRQEFLDAFHIPLRPPLSLNPLSFRRRQRIHQA